MTRPDRGQAYALEGAVAATILLTALLIAAQSAAVTPHGIDDRGSQTQSQLQQETRDALVVAGDDGLSATVRNWHGDATAWNGSAEPNESAFYGTDRPPAGDGDERTYGVDAFAEQSVLGEILQARFAERDRSYNVELVTRGDEDSTVLVDQESPSTEAVTASYAVTLFADDRLTAGDPIDLETAHETRGYPITPTAEDGAVYAVVEVRVTVW
ncbi:DUF7288 family protein [Natronococcus occultus]|uniref:Uncharacterized protein n=1 Tax=Natronococcus occultus SP4 TaxID=694430 RepID=L0JXF3_9EURY|nr:hypothetical protein [Natronococcus occultus]AGB36980.1 hypothetical protein Natoc_1142 [Natronococcus occultus SP4]